jgi:hypothetical protein
MPITIFYSSFRRLAAFFVKNLVKITNNSNFLAIFSNFLKVWKSCKISKRQKSIEDGLDFSPVFVCMYRDSSIKTVSIRTDF